MPAPESTPATNTTQLLKPLHLRPPLPPSLLPSCSLLQSLLLSISTASPSSPLIATYHSFISSLLHPPPPLIDVLDNLQSILLDEDATPLSDLDSFTLSLLHFMTTKFASSNSVSSSAPVSSASVLASLPSSDKGILLPVPRPFRSYGVPDSIVALNAENEKMALRSLADMPDKENVPSPSPNQYPPTPDPLTTTPYSLLSEAITSSTHYQSTTQQLQAELVHYKAEHEHVLQEKTK
ncbi:hypothetical protein TeGR_g4881, partial [Tetraparma gracilis]